MNSWLLPYLVVQQDGTSSPDDDQRTAGEQGKDDPGGTGHDEGLRDTDVVVGLGPHEAPEGNGAGESGEVDEDGGRQALRVQPILYTTVSSILV